MNRASLELLRQVHADWFWPREGARVVLAPWEAPPDLRAVVGPDGTFSPGLGTLGVTALYRTQRGGLSRPFWRPASKAAEGDEDQVTWRLLTERGGAPPTVTSSIEIQRSAGEPGRAAAPARTAKSPRSELAFKVGRFRITETLLPCGRGAAGYFLWRILARNIGTRSRKLSVYVLVRAVGPAGGEITNISWNEGGVLSAGPGRGERPGRLTMRASRLPKTADCFSYSGSGLDASLAVSSVRVRGEAAAEDPAGLASAVLGYEIEVAGGTAEELVFSFPASARRAPFARVETDEAASWEARLDRFSVSVPQEGFNRAVLGSLHHVLACLKGGRPCGDPLREGASVGTGVRIADVLLKTGLFEAARAAVSYVLEDPWGPAGGPSADSPGALLWILGEYLRYTKDLAFISGSWGAVERAMEDIKKMRRLEAPHFVKREPVAWPGPGGLVVGRVGGRVEPLWVNSWAYRGLKEGEHLARALGRKSAAAGARQEAARLLRAITKRLVEPKVEFAGDPERMREALLAAGFEIGGGVERAGDTSPTDLASLVWPCRAAAVDVRPWLRAYFQRKRLRDGVYFSELRSRHHELALAHGCLWAGLPELAWTALEAFLAVEDAPGAWGRLREEAAAPGGGPGRGKPPRGFLSLRAPGVVIPCGRVSAEMFLLLRDTLLFEDGGRIVLFGGMSPAWAGGRSSIEAVMPTSRGLAALRASVEPGKLKGTIDLEGEAEEGVLVAVPGTSGTVLSPGGGAFEVALPSGEKGQSGT